MGKSDLARHLAHLVKDDFDGVIWAEVGPNTPREQFLLPWARPLDVLDQVEFASSIQVRKEWILSAIGGRRMLLMADSVWQFCDAEDHLLGGNCVHFITTRGRECAINFAGDDAVQVCPLAPEDSFKLIAVYARQAVKNYPERIAELSRRMQGWPLALTLIGRWLLKGDVGNQPSRIDAAIASLERAVTFTDLPMKRNDLDTVIALSDRLLSQGGRQCLYALGVLPSMPHSFSEAAALAVSAADAEDLWELLDAGLIDGMQPGRYGLHQSISSYAGEKLGKSLKPVVARMLRHYADFVLEHACRYDELATEFANIAMAVDWAAVPPLNNSEAMDRDVVAIATCISEALLSRGMNTTAVRCLETALAAAERLSDVEGEAKAAVAMARHREKLGEYREAQMVLERHGQAIAQTSDLACKVKARQLLGVIHYNVDDLDEALKHTNLGIERLLGHHAEFDDPRFRREQLDGILAEAEVLSDLFERRSLIRIHQKEWDRASSDLISGFRIARRLCNQDRIATHLRDLCWFHVQRPTKRPAAALARARTVAEWGLNRSIRTGLRESEAALYHRWAQAIAASRGGAAALPYFVRARDIAREIEHRWYLALFSYEIGAIWAEQRDDANAEAILLEAVALATKIENKSIAYAAQLCLAEVRARLGDR